MFNYKVTVTKRDGSEGTYDLGFAELCEFEEITKVGVPVAFRENNIKIQYLGTLGWIAEKAAGNTVKPLAQWLKEVVSVDMQDTNPPTSEVG